ncbi:MAG: tetratricopeptide repeat protein, partial [Erysipelotrichales bacterium]|nr:tetratricopeptide repeat protein [Erysipelotrichales bacterium]
EYAYNRFLKENKPRIYTYFQILPEGTDISEEVRLFMERLGKEISHYYSRFSNLDSIKLNMLLELTRTNHLKDTVDIKDGKALVNGKELMSLENIPVFKNNEEREKYKAEIRKLREEKTRLAVMFASDPDNMDVYKKLSETATRYAELQKTYHDTEKAILDLYSGIVERNSSGESVTWREKKASEYLDNGDYKAALAVLRDPEREEELQRAYEKAGQAEDEFVGYIKEGQLKIDTLKSQGITSATLPEIYAEYEKCVKVAKDKLVKTEFVTGYAYFLRDQKNYTKAIENAEWYRKYRDFKGFDSKKDETGLENLLGLLYTEIRRYKDAETHYRKAIETTEEMPEKDSDLYDWYLAARYNNLGNLLCDTGRFAEAEEYLPKAVKVQKRLAEKNPSFYGGSLALIYNNYGTLCFKRGNFKDAEENYKESVEIYEKLVKENPAHANNLGQSYHNLGYIYSRSNRYKEAEECYLKAIAIREKEVQENPAAYEDDLATNYNNLGLLYSQINRLAEAEEYYLKSIRIQERQAKENPSSYEADLSIAYQNLGDLYRDLRKYDKAEEYYLKVKDIRERLAKEDPSVYQADLAKIYTVFAYCCKDVKRFGEAENYHRKALEIREQLCKENPSSYEGDLAQSCNNLGNFCATTNRYTEAEEYYQRALEIRKRLAAKDPAYYEGVLTASY